MKRNMGAAVLAVTLSAALFTGCSGGSLSSSSTASTGNSKKKTVYIYQNKIEIDSALKEAGAAFTKLHPNITVQVESTADNYATTLKTKFSGGQAPDIFATAGNQDTRLWLDHLDDLSGQSWVGNMLDLAKPAITDNGKIYGMPLGIEGYGFMYRKDLFEKAGITSVPTTLTAFKSVLAKLKASGITPATETYMDWFQAGTFAFNVGLARQPDPDKFIAGLNDGTSKITGNAAFGDLTNLLSAELPYCDSPMNTDFNTQISKFGKGQVAITLGGNWNQPSLDAIQTNLPIGLMPIPINDDAEANDKLYVSVTNYWSVNKDSSSKTEAEEFLDWLATSSEGQSYLSTKFKAIPAFKNIKADSSSIGALGTSVSDYLQKGKVYNIYSSEYPDGGAQAFGESIQKFAAGKATSSQLLQNLQNNWTSLKNKTV